jgi:type III secretion system FlhB-like substrate exporter
MVGCAGRGLRRPAGTFGTWPVPPTSSCCAACSPTCRCARGRCSPRGVVAAGSGAVAERILERARAAGVPVREDAGLADALARLELEAEIPPELWVAVAETLVWAYGLAR